MTDLQVPSGWVCDPIFLREIGCETQVGCDPMTPAVHNWSTNGHLIADVAALYLSEHDSVLDVTYGLGLFWTKWQPKLLQKSDIFPRQADVRGWDFRSLPVSDSSYDVVVFDPPYKLNGTPSSEADERYGVDVPTTPADRLKLMRDGLQECCRVARRLTLVKCQDQVVSGHICWQTDMMTETAAGCGFQKVDRFDMIGHCRPQPPGRPQQHAYGRGSTLLVFLRTRSPKW